MLVNCKTLLGANIKKSTNKCQGNKTHLQLTCQSSLPKWDWFEGMLWEYTAKLQDILVSVFPWITHV